MADGFTELTLDSIQTPDGINQVNRILRQLYDNIAGDAENIRVFNGYGSPEGVITAGIGSVYLRADGGAGTSVYAKESGTGNTGWTAISGAAPVSFPLSTANGGLGADASGWTSGDVLYLSGTGVISHQAFPTSVNTSNVLFQYQGVIDGTSGASGQAEYSSTSLTPAYNVATNFRFLVSNTRNIGSGAGTTVWSSKWIKLSGISTITIYARLWIGLTTGSPTTKLRINVGGQTLDLSATAGSTTPTWYSGTIDVSGLSNGTAYDVICSLGIVEDLQQEACCANIVAFGS